jgi:hypothetical protein
MLREPVQLADASLFAEPQDIALPSASQAGFRAAAEQAARADEAMMAELRSMKGLIEQRFGALAFMEKLQRQPAPGARWRRSCWRWASRRLLTRQAWSRACPSTFAGGADELHLGAGRAGAQSAGGRAQPLHERRRRVRAGRLHRRRQDHHHRQAGRRLCRPAWRRATWA